MDKSCHSSSGVGEEEESLSSSSASAHINPNYLKNLHKLSHKISKPPIRKPFEFHPQQLVIDESNHHLQQQQQQQQHQPPVYNVSKSDFRDVVQKLTGSPAHIANPVQQPVKPQTSRLHKIRPPPLEHVGNRPPAVAGVQNPGFRPGFVSGGFFTGKPLSPLPPLPTVHATAESPISAYMRCFQTNTAAGAGGSSRWSNQPPPPNPVSDFPAPASPLPFGCNSPKSMFPMSSPGYPFSPGSQFGFQQLTPALSPTPPAPSPRWKSL